MLYFIQNLVFLFLLSGLQIWKWWHTLGAVAAKNCRTFRVSVATEICPAAKSQLNPVPTSLCCQGAGLQVGRVSAFSLPPPVPSWWLSPDFCPCSQGHAGVGLTVSQEPLNFCRTEQHGHPQTTPGCIFFPHWYINLLAKPCPRHFPCTKQHRSRAPLAREESWHKGIKLHNSGIT